MAESKQSTYAKNKFEMNINDFIFSHLIHLLKRLPTPLSSQAPLLFIEASKSITTAHWIFTTGDCQALATQARSEVRFLIFL